ncbi:DUF4157 domain-containing protein [Streptomyces sp. NPDC053542]|uniref:eCIS core domain-containing protein n=1 Tax=Streptomyces sp. NPDC053542 TaxID=3365710 RepID=UPI0037D1F29B
MSTHSSSQDTSQSTAAEKRRKRRERNAKSRTPEPKDIVSGAGQPLDLSVRRELEEQLGHDFSQVRLHTDRESGQLAELMGADAFAVGQDIFFREGAYRPGTADGQRLLAHELLHTVQNPHGLGALRAGRDLGSVSLPQETIEREAESAAQSSVLGALQDSVRTEEPAAEIEEGRATPGWLRYATVDADRSRMEQVDPATLVDRLANGLLRSLRGDPEDRSRRVRLQLARMAPQVQESVLDRLEVRLSTPDLDRLLDLVEEVEEGPLPLEPAVAPEPVPDEMEVIGQERASAAAAARDKRKKDEKESDGRRKRAQQRKDADPAGDGAPERGGQSAAGGTGTGKASAAGARSSAERPAGQDTGAASARQTEQAQANQQDKDAAQQAAQKDEESAARGQEEDAPEQTEDGPAAADAESRGAGEEREDAAAKDSSSDPEALDKSAAEPGEKERTAADPDERRGKGDPENEEDADDEPLGLEEDSAELDEDDEDGAEDEEDAADDPDLADEEEADSSGAEGDPSEDGLNGSAASDAKQQRQNDSAAGKRSGPPGVLDSPVDKDQTDEAARRAADGPGGSGSRSPEEKQEADDRLAADLETDKSIEQEIGPEPDEKAEDKVGEESGEQSSDPADPEDAEEEKQLAAERKEDAEAKRRDQEARHTEGGTGGSASGTGGDTTAPDRLSKADEDARKQAAGSSSESATGAAAGSDSGTAAGSGDGKSTSGSADKDTKPSSGSGEKSGTDTGTGSGAGSAAEAAPAGGSTSGPAAGKDEDKASGGAASDTGEKSQDETSAEQTAGTKGASEDKAAAGSTDAAQGKAVTEGKGPATVPGPDAGPDKVSAAGPAFAPKLSPGKGTAAPSAAAGAKGGAAQGGTPAAGQAAKPGPGKPAARPKAAATPKQRQTARQAAKNVRRGGGGSGGRTAPAPARGGGRGGGRATSGAAKPKKDAPAPDVSKSTPEAGLATVAKLKPYQMLETFKGVNSAVSNSVGKERAALHKGPPKTERPTGSPRTVPGGPTPAAPGTYTNAKVARTDAAKGKTPEINGEQRPEGKPPGADVPEPSWWDILLTIGGALLKKIFPFDDLIDSIMDLPKSDDGLKGAKVGDAPGVPLQDDSDPARTDEQGQKLDERKTELHQAGREDAARPMGEDQIYPDVPSETLTGKVPGGKKKAGQKGGGAGKGPGGGVPVESASAVAEHDRGPQIQAGFTEGHQKMGQERKDKDKRAKDDKQKHDQDLKREVDASSKKQAGEREKGRSTIADARGKWRKEQDDKVAEIDDKKGKKYDKVRKDIDDKNEQTDKDVDKRTEDDNKKVDDEQDRAEKDAEKKQEDKKKEAEKGDGGFLDSLKQWWENLKNDIKNFFERARKAVTDLIDKFKREVFKLIDDVRNWVVKQINDFADALIAFGDEMLAEYPAMRDKWRNTINAGRDYAVKKVNEAADALKDVAGKLLDGLCSALIAGLDMLETGLNAAVEVAETVTVKAVEFGQAVVAGLGEWAAIFNDIVSDPGGWISKAGAAAETGAKEYLFDEIKAAVKEWFNQKVQEIIGIPMEDFQELISGGVSAKEMGQMAWDEALPQLPVIIGVMVMEKVVAKLIPGAGWVMTIIDALQTAWGALSEILAAFGLFMDFLKSVKSGNGARPFAKAVAAGVVALLELIYQFLIEGVSRFMGGVTRKLGDMLKNLRKKKRPDGGSDGPGTPGAPAQNNRPGQNEGPGHNNQHGPADRPGQTAQPARPRQAEKPGEPGQTDKPGQRPAPRKPSPDKTSRPEQGPRPGKRPSPEKKPHPTQQSKPKSKKKPDEHERRDDGREVNAARRRANDAKRKQHDEDKARPGKPRRGPARDTLRKKRRPDGRHLDRKRDRDKDRTEDLLRKKKQKHDDKGHDKDRDKDGKKKVSTKKRPRKPESRTRRKLRRARQTIKSAVNRARRAARRLFGKGRKLGRKLNNRTHRLRDQWRRRRDRLRRDRSRRRNRRRDRKREDNSTKEVDLPKVRFRDVEDGEAHTLSFHGRGPHAPLYIHSTPQEVPAFTADWQRDIGEAADDPDTKKQQKLLAEANNWYTKAKTTQKGIPTRTQAKESETKKKERADRLAKLREEMQKFSNAASQRKYYDIPTPAEYHKSPGFQDFSNPATTKRGTEEYRSDFLGTPSKTIFGGQGEDASKAKKGPNGQPPGWNYVTSKKLSQGAAWVKMHLLPERLGGKATGNNLVPARGPSTNIAFLNNIEDIAYHAIPKSHRIIWYETKVEFNHANFPNFPSHIQAKYGGYDPTPGTSGKNKGDWTPRKTAEKQYNQSPKPPSEDEEGMLAINHAGHQNLEDMLGVKRSIADHLIDVRGALKEKGETFTSYTQVEDLMWDLKDSKKKGAMPELGLLLRSLKKLDDDLKVDWS